MKSEQRQVELDDKSHAATGFLRLNQNMHLFDYRITFQQLNSLYARPQRGRTNTAPSLLMSET
jgi:hypothetical protein